MKSEAQMQQVPRSSLTTTMTPLSVRDHSHTSVIVPLNPLVEPFMPTFASDAFICRIP
jgi:hypothetical protein